MKTTVSDIQTAVACRHCATPFLPRRDEEDKEEFCCSGCQFVFHLLHRRGLEDFYHYGETKSPVGSSVFQDPDTAWITELQKSVEEKAGPNPRASATVQIQGISCAGCIWLLEAIFAEHPGAVSAEVDSTSGTIRLRWIRGKCDLAGYARDCGRFGYTLGPMGAPRSESTRPLVRKLGLCGALALNAMLFALPGYLGLLPGEEYSALFATLAFAIATTSLVVGGSHFFRRAWQALRLGEIHIDLPISVGLLVAYAGSVLFWIRGENSLTYFDFVSVFTFLMVLGRWLQERAVEKNRNRLLSVRLTPGKLTVLRHGLEVEIPAESLESGERFWIARGQLVPVRARLLSKAGVFALNWINGEPAPRTFSHGSLLASGARSVSPQRLEALALENWSQSQLATLLSLDGRGRSRN
jgi:P-type Cu2+ transporter